MLDGILGNYTGSEHKIELLEGAKPFPIPKIHKETLKTEVNRLINKVILNYKKVSKWAAPTFKIPEKNGAVHFISDFRELNKRIKENFSNSKNTRFGIKIRRFSIRHLT